MATSITHSDIVHDHDDDANVDLINVQDDAVIDLDDDAWSDSDLAHVNDDQIPWEATPGAPRIIKAIKLALFRLVVLTGRIPRRSASEHGNIANKDPSMAKKFKSTIHAAEPETRSVWVKGTGYGDFQSPFFDVNSAINAKRAEGVELADQLDSLQAMLAEAPPNAASYLSSILTESNITTSLIAILNIDSMLEADLYNMALLSCLRLCTWLSTQDEMSLIGYIDSFSGQSIYGALARLKLKAEDAIAIMSSAGREAGTLELDQGIAGKIIEAANATLAACPVSASSAQDEADESAPSSSVADGNSQLDPVLANKYEDYMKEHRFEMVPDFAQHSFKKMATGAPPSSVIRRLAHEVLSLRTSLPFNHDSSVLVRASQADMRLMKVVIFPCSDTPYWNGAFEFDVMFPNDYPASPPKMQLITTGRGQVRFNPNLYACGKVCLSLLGTWAGQASEKWNATSSFLQVVVSIQALIFITNPYFNEPSFAKQQGSSYGDTQSEHYNANIRKQTVRWAMTDMLQSPPVELADAIRMHFRLKRDLIKSQVKSWKLPREITEPLISALDALPDSTNTS